MAVAANVDNAANSAKPITTATQSAFYADVPHKHPDFALTVGGISKAATRLATDDNTSDAANPMRAATQ